MNSRSGPDQETVLADLGEEFLLAFMAAVEGARHDLREFEAFKPQWAAAASARFTANLIHERIWDRLASAVEGMDGVTAHDREPTRQLVAGLSYVMRVKRHDHRDRIAAYPTRERAEFWGLAPISLDGMERVSLALGYYWDPDVREIGDPVISFRDGVDRPLWAVRLRSQEGAATGFTWEPLAPELPELDLSALVDDREEEAGS